MKTLIAALLVLGFGGTLTTVGESVPSETAPSGLLVMDVARVAAESPVETNCGFWERCGIYEHEITREEGEGTYWSHECWSPLIHSGPSCGEEENVPTPELLAASEDQVVEWVRDGTLMRLDRISGRVESLSCDGVGMISSVSLERLGMTLADFQ